jgi:hypothetical protein
MELKSQLVFTQCNFSNHTILDQQGIHITSVCGTDAAISSIIHDKSVHTLNQFICLAGYRTTVEPTGCFSLYSDTNARPDISVQSYSTSQEKTLIDISLTSPITSDNFNNGKSQRGYCWTDVEEIVSEDLLENSFVSPFPFLSEPLDAKNFSIALPGSPVAIID